MKEALKYLQAGAIVPVDMETTILLVNALKEALAQPAQEPVCPECKAEVLYECVACSSNNYPPQGAQEPVAWMYDWLCDGKLITGWIAHSEPEIPQLMGSNIRPLYTAPPQRTWVGSGDLEDSNAYQTPPAAAQPEQERNFCERCGKRTPDLTTIHTCTPPQENT